MSGKPNTYIVTHSGMYPVGACSVVVAESEEHARALLDAELSRIGLGIGGYEFISFDPDIPGVTVVLDGEY